MADTAEIESVDGIDEGFESFESSFTEAFSRGATTETPTPVVQEVLAEPAVIEPVVETATPIAEPVLSESLTGLLGQAAQYGVSTDGIKTEAELTGKILARMQEMQPYVEYANGLLPHADEVREFLAGKNKPAPEQAEAWDEASYFNKQYGGPVFTEEHQKAAEAGLVTRDPETGLWVAAPGFETSVAPLIGDMNAAQQHSARFWQQQARGNPLHSTYRAIEEPIMRKVKEYVDQFIGSHEQKNQVRSKIDQFEVDNTSWLYQQGSRNPTPEGKAFIDTINELKTAGVSDPDKLLSMATRLTGRDKPTAPTAPTAPAVVAPVAPVSQIPPPPTKTFLESARTRAAHSPSANGATAGQPQVNDDGDLNSMFTRAFRVNRPA